MTKDMIMLVYAVIIIALGIVGYMLGKKDDKQNIYAVMGVVIGVVLCALLWHTAGKKILY